MEKQKKDFANLGVTVMNRFIAASRNFAANNGMHVEVQTEGSPESLLRNLIKFYNPAIAEKDSDGRYSDGSESAVISLVLTERDCFGRSIKCTCRIDTGPEDESKTRSNSEIFLDRVPDGIAGISDPEKPVKSETKQTADGLKENISSVSAAVLPMLVKAVTESRRRESIVSDFETAFHGWNEQVGR
jgi:hypothetical protein